MAKLIIPAARVRQGALNLFATSLRVKDLLAKNFYSVDTLDPEDEDNGYQRLLNKARAKKLAEYILRGQDTKRRIPSDLRISRNGQIAAFQQQRPHLEIDSAAVGSFSVVDGQHRLEGLRMAAEKDARVYDFEIPVVTLEIRVSTSVACSCIG